MEQEQNTVAEILLKCEENGTAPKYVVQQESYKKNVRTKPIVYNTNGEEIFVVSDFHIASGRNEAGVYSGTENFFADDSFKRFLDYANYIKKTGNAILIINGDIFDFLRITEYPGKVRRARFSKRLKRALKLNPLKKPEDPSIKEINDEYEEWIRELKKIGINKTRTELENCISKRERKYGLGTDDYKTIYKLSLIRKGHPEFIEALAKWLVAGNKIIVVKGNHDLELYWLAVRNYLRLIFTEDIIKRNRLNNSEKILTEVVLPNITFIDDSVEIDNDFYVEHGHRYDKFCMVLENPLLEKKSGQINIPFGSFFNRYLLNRVELFYPYLDNVRPSVNVLPILMRENFPLGLKVLFQHIPLLIRILFTNFRYIRFMLSKVFLFVIALIIPVGLLIYSNLSVIEAITAGITKVEESSGIAATAIEQIKNLVLLFLSYFLSRLVAWFQLTEPSTLHNFAKQRFDRTNYKIMTMGHTHNPGEYLFNTDNNEIRFYNTGTWIPVIETSTAEIREDKTYTFLHLVRNEKGKLIPSKDGLLQRWNDEAGRPEVQILIQRK